MEQSNLVNLRQYKLDRAKIKIGDFVEWQDYDNTLHVAKVERLFERLSDEVDIDVDSINILEKDEYTFGFKDGMKVIGSAVVRKVQPKKTYDRDAHNRKVLGDYGCK